MSAKYRILIINSLQEPEVAGEYSDIHDMLLALLLLLKTYSAVIVEKVKG